MFIRPEGGRGTADKCYWHVWGVLTVFRPHWVCPHSRRVCFPRLHCSGSRLLCREQALSCVHFPGLSCSGSGSRVLHKGADSVRPAFWELDECTLFRCSLTSPLLFPTSVSGHAWSGSRVPCVSSGELISGCNSPGGCQPFRISGSLWLETGNLFAVW